MTSSAICLSVASLLALGCLPPAPADPDSPAPNGSNSPAPTEADSPAPTAANPPTAAAIENALGAQSTTRAATSNCTAGYNFTGDHRITIPGTSLQIELAALPGCNQKFVLALFGGGWAAGQSSDMDYLAIPMLQRGIVYGSLNYTTNVPMSFITAEVALALNAVRAGAGILGIDPAKMGILGFSAGGQLAYQGGFADGHVAWIGGLYGPTDMTALADADCNPNTVDGAINIQGGICADIINVMVGFPNTNPGAYQAFSPVNSAGNAAATRGVKGVFIGYSVDDIIVPPDQAAKLESRLQSLGIPFVSDQTTGFHGANLPALSLQALDNAQSVLQ